MKPDSNITLPDGALGSGATEDNNLQITDNANLNTQSRPAQPVFGLEQEFLRANLPNGRYFRFLVAGDVTKGDLNRIIRILKVQSKLLDENDESSEDDAKD